MRSLWLALDSIGRRLDRARTLHVASDLDGTLTPIVSHPDRVVLDPRVRRVLRRLSRAPRARLAIVSGRRIADLRRRVGLRGVFYAGSGGFETMDAKGRMLVHVAAQRHLPDELRETMRRWCERFPGAWVEDKGLTLALHYRSVSPSQWRAFRAGVLRRVVRGGRHARATHGKRVFEITPRVPWGKREVLDHWLGEPSDRSLVFYFGDDSNDEPVYGAIARRRGIGVAVGRKVSRARYSLEHPDDVAQFLEWLEREWTARGGTRAARPR